jgi:hypothetical protein
MDADWDADGGELFVTGGIATGSAVVYTATGDMLHPVQILPTQFQPGGKLNAMAWNPDWSEALLVGDRENGAGPGRVLRFDGHTFTAVPYATSPPVDLRDVAWRPDGSLALIVGGLEASGLSVVCTYVPGVGVAQIGTLTFGRCEAVAWSPSGSEALIVTLGPSPGQPGAVLRFDGASLQPLGYPASLPWKLDCVDFHPEEERAVIGGGTYSGTECVLLRYAGGVVEEMTIDPELGRVRALDWDPAGDFALAITSLPDGRRARLITNGLRSVRFHDDELVPPINAFAWAPEVSSGAPETWLAPGTLALCNRPNPFHSRTTVFLDLPTQAPARLEVLDIQGRVVRTLLNGEELSAGRRAFEWNGTDDAGRDLPRGLYLCRAQVDRRTATAKLLRVR